MVVYLDYLDYLDGYLDNQGNHILLGAISKACAMVPCMPSASKPSRNCYRNVIYAP